jgi:L-lactate permease
MRKTSVTALLVVGMIAFARPALAGSDNPQSFSGLQGVRAEQLSDREMARITGQGLSMVSNAIGAIGAALATSARK